MFRREHRNKSFDLGLDNGFLDMTTKAPVIKKNQKFIYIKINVLQIILS